MVSAPGAPERKARPNIAFARVNTASFLGERGDATLRIPADLVITSGAQLAEGCFVGKELGRGIQVSKMPLHVHYMPSASRCNSSISQGGVLAVTKPPPF